MKMRLFTSKLYLLCIQDFGCMANLKFGSTIDNIWNLLHVVTDQNEPTEYIAVRGEFFKPEDEQVFIQLLSSKKVIGVSSFQNFPAKCKNPFQTDRPGHLKDDERFINRYGHHVILWCHCFKLPRQFIPASIPYLLLSETDQYEYFPTLLNMKSVPKEYDFVVSMPGGAWNSWIRGLDVAQQWINYMAETMGLRILVIGNDRQTDFSPKVTVLEFQPWRQFMECISKCNALFCASKYDASPRVLIEAMALNLPVLVNENILGGWKYVNDVTGQFFCPDEPIGPAVTQFMNKIHQHGFHPRSWIEHNLQPEQGQMALTSALCALHDLSWADVADGLIFINLDKRADRLSHMKKMVTDYGFPNNFCHRLAAVENTICGHLGCAQSHIAALQFALAQGWNRAIILEDDFQFRLPRERVLFILHEFVHKRPEPWDVFMLTAYYTVFKHKHEDSYFKQLSWGSTTAGYLVNGRDYMQKLLRFWQDGLLKLKTDVQQFELQRKKPSDRLLLTDHAIDVQWRSLQEQDHFYISEPQIGQQNNSPSSIMV